MISPRKEKIGLSFFMIINPIIFGLLIMFPSRYVYLAYLVLIAVGYIAHKQFSLVLGLVTDVFRSIIKKYRKPTREETFPAEKSNETEEHISNS
jgi:hypothetical protein